jgi:uncharacterized membrane protein YkoI
VPLDFLYAASGMVQEVGRDAKLETVPAPMQKPSEQKLRSRSQPILSPSLDSCRTFSDEHKATYKKKEATKRMNEKKVLVGIFLAMAMVFVIGGVAYAQTTTDDGDDTVKGSVSAPDPAKIGKAAAEQAALEAQPGEVTETELETNDSGYVVYDIEIAGDDGKNHEVTVDAGNGEILYQELEDEVDDSDAGETDDSD